MEPFRFLDLPGEIRNKIYQIVLCIEEPPKQNERGLQEVPTELTQLRHHIETQILRTCRSVYAEANYVMLNMNLFVKVTVKIPFEGVRSALIAKRVPILQMDGKRVKHFKAFVMSHDITPRSWAASMPEKSRIFVLLHRDLNHFCGAIANLQWLIERNEELVSHIITLVDPFEGDNLPSSQPFYSRKLQERLIAPYRSALRGIPHFAIKGAISQDLSAAAVSEITRAPANNPETILRELEELKSKGNEDFRNGDGPLASESWAQAMLKIHRVMGGTAGRELRAAGGVDFVDQITALFFTLSSNRAQNYVKAMRENLNDPETVRSLGEGLFRAVDDALTARSRFPGTTWEPFPQQVAKVFYREAVGCRLIGGREFFLQAQTAIESAIRAMPGDAELEREQQRVSQWRSRIM